jgi:hypothetical protein
MSWFQAFACNLYRYGKVIFYLGTPTAVGLGIGRGGTSQIGDEFERVLWRGRCYLLSRHKI